MKVINCCNHDVEICDENGNIIKVYKPSGYCARLKHDVRFVDDIDGVPVKVRENNKVIGLPRPEEGTFYIVSDIILKAAHWRQDLLGCGGKYFNDDGSVRGWTAFTRNMRKS